MTIPLIDKFDNFEIVDVQIAAILAQATIDQQALALADGKDPDLWKFDVFSEKMNPFEAFQDDKEPDPIVNVWWDSSSFNPKDGDIANRQKDDAIYNIDVYAAVSASDDPGGGHNPVDESSILALHRIVRLVRNIIMHPDNTSLQLTQTVGERTGNLIWRRWIQSKEIFQPQIGDRPVQGVIAARIVLSVSFNEVPVLASFETIEVIGVTAKRAEDGKIILEADFDTT